MSKIFLEESVLLRCSLVLQCQEDYPVSGDINITNTGVDKLLQNLNPHKAAFAADACE
jgi:hypothetical protein